MKIPFGRLTKNFFPSNQSFNQTFNIIKLNFLPGLAIRRYPSFGNIGLYVYDLSLGEESSSFHCLCREIAKFGAFETL